MFGFLGKPVCELIIESNGATLVSTRTFLTGYAYKRSEKRARYFFDWDNVNVVKANQQTLLSPPLVSYNGVVHAAPPVTGAGTSHQGRFGGNTGPNVLMNRGKSYRPSQRGFSYSSSAALSPATRKIRYDLHYYLLETIVIGAPASNGSERSATSNSSIGTLSINMTKFPELKHFRINETWISVLNIVSNNSKLESFDVTELPNLTTINGKIPKSVKIICLGELGTLTSIATLISECVNAETFMMGIYSGQVNVNIVNQLDALTGTLDISHMTLLKEVVLCGGVLTGLNIPLGKTDWEWFHLHIFGATLGAAFNTVVLDNVLASPNLINFACVSTRITYAKTVTNSEIATTLKGWYSYGNSFTGNITINAARPALLDFRTGNNSTRAGIQLNSHPVVNLTGLTDALIIDLTGSNIEDLQLPVNTVCNTLNLYDNKLDIVTNASLVSQVNAMTGLITLQFSNNNTTGPVTGQVSTNGLGANPNFSGLVNLTTLQVGSCKITGTLTLPNVNKLILLQAKNNPGMTSILNIAAHAPSLQTINVLDCNALVLNITSAFTSWTNILFSKTQSTSLDLSGKTTTTVVPNVYIQDNDVLTTITLPTVTGRCAMQNGGHNFDISSNDLLTSIVNLEFVSYAGTGGTCWCNIYNNALLNQTIPLGTNSFLPTTIQLQNNALSSANINATIDSLYTNRNKWVGNPLSKSLNIGGVGNGVATGTYQAPVGFVLGSNDGTPASQKEKIYVLVNNYGWTVTMN